MVAEPGVVRVVAAVGFAGCHGGGIGDLLWGIEDVRRVARWRGGRLGRGRRLGGGRGRRPGHAMRRRTGAGVTGSEEEENRGGRRCYRGRTLPRDGSRDRRTLMIKPETVPNQ
jgi:hypothetical protein